MHMSVRAISCYISWFPILGPFPEQISYDLIKGRKKQEFSAAVIVVVVMPQSIEMLVVLLQASAT